MRRRTRTTDFRPIEEVAASAGALLPRRDRGRHLAALAAWRAAVGERVQRRTRVSRVDGDCLTVEVPDEAWGDSLRRLHAEILGRVQRTLGEQAPRRIEFRVVPGVWRPASRPRPSRRSIPRPPGGGPDPSGVPGADSSGPAVSQPVEERLQRAAGRYLARSARSRRSGEDG